MSTENENRNGFASFRTPEAIRADQEARAARRAAARDDTPYRELAAARPEPVVKAKPGTKRPITVTVDGVKGSGKTTLISIVAQALRSADHKVITDDHVPPASMAVADLHEQFDVTFVETDGTGKVPYVFQARIDEQAERIKTLEATNEKWAQDHREAVDSRNRVATELEGLRRTYANTLNDLMSARAAAERLNTERKEFFAQLETLSRDSCPFSNAFLECGYKLDIVGRMIESVLYKAKHDEEIIRSFEARKDQIVVDLSADVQTTIDTETQNLIARQSARIAELEKEAERLDSEGDFFEKLAGERAEEIDRLKAVRPVDQAQAEQNFGKVMTMLRDAAIIDLDRTRIRQEIESLQAKRRTMDGEARARERKASELLRLSMGLTNLPDLHLTKHVEYQHGGSLLSATDKLNIANGADGVIL